MFDYCRNSYVHMDYLKTGGFPSVLLGMLKVICNAFL